jgi:hypothetical protein
MGNVLCCVDEKHNYARREGYTEGGEEEPISVMRVDGGKPQDYKDEALLQHDAIIFQPNN